MDIPQLGRFRCMKCGKAMVDFAVHIRVTVELQDGKSTVQRYCAECCQDPIMAVLFRHVLEQPVKRIEVFAAFR